MNSHKTVVALDMDNTTIFSPRKFFFKDGEYSPLLRVIDRSGNHSSYMTETACNLFEELTSIATVVAVTSRSMKKYDRLVLPPNSASFYSVCGNGLEIRTPDGFDKEWESELRGIVRNTSISLSELKSLAFDSLSLKEVNPTKDKGNLILSAHVPDESDPEVFLEAVTNQLAGSGYSCSLQGAKINIYPLELSKDKGLNRVFGHMGGRPENLLVAGDSMMDLSIMKMADKCYYPSNGGIPLNELPEGAYTTNNQGILAGEEILRLLVQDVENINKGQDFLF